MGTVVDKHSHGPLQYYLAGFPSLPRNARVTGLRGVGKTVLLRRAFSSPVPMPESNFICSAR